MKIYLFIIFFSINSFSEDLKIAYFETDIDSKYIFKENYDYQGSLIKANKWTCSGKFNSKKNPVTKSDFKVITMTCNSNNLDLATDFQVICDNQSIMKSTFLTFRSKKEYKAQLSLLFYCYDDDYKDNIFFKNEQERIKFIRSMIII